MMLPPPPRLAMNSSSTTIQQRPNLTQPIPRQQVSHMEWLQRMNQAAVSLFPFSSPYNPGQNNISTTPSPHDTQHSQDNCTKQQPFPTPLPSVSPPSPPMNNISSSKHEIVTPNIPLSGTM